MLHADVLLYFKIKVHVTYHITLHYMMLDCRVPRAPFGPFIIFSTPADQRALCMHFIASWSSWFMIAANHAVFSALALKPLAPVLQPCLSLIAFGNHALELEEHNPACQHSLQRVAAQPMSQNCSWHHHHYPAHPASKTAKIEPTTGTEIVLPATRFSWLSLGASLAAGQLDTCNWTDMKKRDRHQ